MSDLATHAHDLSHHTSDHVLAAIRLPATGTLDTATTSGAGLAIPGAATVVPAGDPRPYEVVFGANLYTDVFSPPQTAMLQLREDGNTIALAMFTNWIVNLGIRTSHSRRRRMPALISHTYTLWISSLAGGNVHALGYATAGSIAIEALTL